MVSATLLPKATSNLSLIFWLSFLITSNFSKLSSVFSYSSAKSSYNPLIEFIISVKRIKNSTSFGLKYIFSVPLSKGSSNSTNPVSIMFFFIAISNIPPKLNTPPYRIGQGGMCVLLCGTIRCECDCVTVCFRHSAKCGFVCVVNVTFKT